MNGMGLDVSIPCPSQVPVLEEISNVNAPSPNMATSQSRLMKTEGRSRIPQLTRTPEPSIFMRKEVQVAMENNEVGFIKKSQQLNSSSINRKGSQIRKSLQTIGKIIHGPERR